MTDTLSWLAEPESIAFGGYSVVLARGLDPAELVARIAAEAVPRCTARPLGPYTGEDLIEEHELDLASGTEDLALRHGQVGDLAYAVAYGYWQGELGIPATVSRGGAEVYHVEYEEENGKPVPPNFSASWDGRPLCSFNLHLDSSWGFDGVDGDPETAAAVTADLAAAGLPDPEREKRDVHRTCLELLGRRFGLALPRAAVLDGELPAVLLEAA
ncbi:hypothetical protein [Streptomyces sp. CBMA123]|uniref:hypothetical protein n=1 Tax=Streptomyces sp. CBMA123 TaxID=1896313 RepID=UPI001662195B|nr:hypothetical protein [Streptomyces sp. CBMA123]MBD0689529.1 hypothetical protein [Streptomyces sp. CBMA123]